MIRLEDVWRIFKVGEGEVHALKDVSLAIGSGEHVAVVGPSGSGKSTLLHIVGCLDRPTRGRYLLEGREVGTLSEEERSLIRRRRIGFVFQFFHLLPRLSALGNVELPMLFAGTAPDERRDRAAHALKAVGLSHRAGHRPHQLSGGECQRVAIARAVVMDPAVLLADEPTGNLDRAAAGEVMELIETMNARGLTLVVVTHDPAIAARARRVIRMDDGAIEATGHRAPGTGTEADKDEDGAQRQGGG